MNNISDVAMNNAAMTGSEKTTKTGGTTGNYGKTLGNVKLSEEGAKYYEELKKKFSGMDFVLVSKDMKDYAKQNASSFGNANRMVVLIDEEKIEKMATDKDFRAKYEGLISSAQSKLPELKSVMQNNANVKTIGMQVTDSGTASFFAVMQKSSEDLTEKLAAKRAAKKAAEKAEEKKAAKKELKEEMLERAKEKAAESQESDDDYVILQADSVEELLRKIEDYNFSLRADSAVTPQEKLVGQSIDFKG